MMFIAFVMSSCTNVEKAFFGPDPVYRFGSKVFVANGFYKGCQGNTIAVNKSVQDNSTFFEYEVDSLCHSVDGHYSKQMILKLKEEDLIEDVSE